MTVSPTTRHGTDFRPCTTQDNFDTTPKQKPASLLNLKTKHCVCAVRQTQPWGRAAMSYWSKYVPLDNLVMGLPAYDTDYFSEPGMVLPAPPSTLPATALPGL